MLRRAGFTCDTVSVGKEIVCGSHGIRVLADRLLEETDPESYDMVVLPGGLPGADTLRDNETVLSWVRSFAGRDDRYVAAICAAPQVLARAGITRGAEYVDDNRLTDECVITDGNLITSRGPGTTLPFAFRLAELLGGDAETLREAMQYNALKESWLQTKTGNGSRIR